MENNSFSTPKKLFLSSMDTAHDTLLCHLFFFYYFLLDNELVPPTMDTNSHETTGTVVPHSHCIFHGRCRDNKCCMSMDFYSLHRVCCWLFDILPLSHHTIRQLNGSFHVSTTIHCFLLPEFPHHTVLAIHIVFVLKTLLLPSNPATSWFRCLLLDYFGVTGMFVPPKIGLTSDTFLPERLFGQSRSNCAALSSIAQQQPVLGRDQKTTTTV